MSADAPKYGWYGDDFTGATDTLATLAEAGLRAMLFLRVPEARHIEAAGRLDAVGIAGAARAMTPDAMRAELEPVGRFFASLGVSLMHYKCCSTFDSAPHIGSIGVAVETLKPFFPNPLLPIIGGQPSLGRYCLFSTLFASAGAGGVVERIDRHPTMMRHPVTPMGEADLRRHLAVQGLGPIGAVHFPDYGNGAFARRLDDVGAILLDVAASDQLAAIGAALWKRAEMQPMLCVGASSVAQSMRDSLGAGGDARVAGLKPAAAPVFVLAGSLSPVTARQIEQAGARFEIMQGDGLSIVADEAYRNGLISDAIEKLRAGRNVILVTAPTGDWPQRPVAPEQVAAASALLLSDLLRRHPLPRVGVAGGDTSSRAVQHLDAWGLAHAATLAPGVAVCRLRSDDPGLDGVEIMLKGGQMGPPDVFARLLDGVS